ncbi:MAG: hypothetical protein ACI3YS_04580, partial [Prevotella sp.]
MDILFLFVGNSGSNGIKPTDEFLAIEPCHLDMLNLFEGRIEATRIVAHFHQTVDIDDKALDHLCTKQGSRASNVSQLTLRF